ncbi:MAG: hypothetical protein HY236_13980 [Acidobacteria bacterium]|nr:hypothetical protein [Acidobacteriota bacterium]
MMMALLIRMIAMGVGLASSAGVVAGIGMTAAGRWARLHRGGAKSSPRFHDILIPNSRFNFMGLSQDNPTK